MLKKPFLILTSLFFVFSNTFASDEEAVEKPVPFSPFTGKVVGNRVRLRTQPSLEAPIVTQLKTGEVFVVQGEDDEFYSIVPPEGTKAYVHRKFVLDGEIDGERVNIRLYPDLDSPVIGKLNTGDKVDGKRSGEKKKWLEIDPPQNTRFYVYKDYVENVGGPEIALRLEKTRKKYQELITTAPEKIQTEFKKSFPEVEIDQILTNLNQIVKDQSHFPHLAEQAQEIINEANELYLNKKITYLESITENSSNVWTLKNENLQKEMEQHKKQVEVLTAKLEETPPSLARVEEDKAPEMLYWERAEATQFEEWASHKKGYADYEAFYAEQERKAKEMEGILTRPNHSTHNAPGDYLLVNERTNLPIAYLYSTRINLQNRLGRKVTVRGVERPNNHFAFPAYYVLSSS